MEIEHTMDNQRSKNGTRLVGPKAKDQGPVEDLLEATTALTMLIQEESRLLQARRIRDIKPLQQEKPRLTAAYEEALGKVRADLTVLGKDGSKARRDLQNATQKFQDTLVAHGRILLRLKSVTEGLVKSVYDETEKQRPSVRNYKGNASIRKPKAENVVPIALNQII